MPKPQELIKKIQQGDQASFDQFYLSLRPKFIHWIRKHYQKEESAAVDLFQQSMLYTYENILKGKLNDLSSNLDTYVFGVAKNIIRNNYRSSAIHQKHEEKLTQHYKKLSTLEFNNESSQTELIALTKQLFPKLKTGCQNILRLFYFEEKKAKEIAQKLGLNNEQVVRTQKSRCLKYLKQLLAEHQSKKKD